MNTTYWYMLHAEGSSQALLRDIKRWIGDENSKVCPKPARNCLCLLIFAFISFLFQVLFQLPVLLMPSDESLKASRMWNQQEAEAPRPNSCQLERSDFAAEMFICVYNVSAPWSSRRSRIGSCFERSAFLHTPGVSEYYFFDVPLCLLPAALLIGTSSSYGT